MFAILHFKARKSKIKRYKTVLFPVCDSEKSSIFAGEKRRKIWLKKK